MKLDNLSNIIRISLSRIMKQIITINIGDPGIKIGDQTLSLYLKEHYLNPEKSGHLVDIPMNDSSIFHQIKEGKHQYRAIALDCDMSAINELKTGANRQLYNPRYCIGNKQISLGTFSHENYIFHREMENDFLDNFQRMLQSCDSMQGLIVNVSTLGGTSGILDRVSRKIVGEGYVRKIPKVAFAIYPSRYYSSSVVGIYNYILSSQCLLEDFDLVIPFDNQTLYNHATSQLDIQNPGFHEINDIIAQVESTVTLSMRSHGTLDTKLNDLCTNMVSYPQMHYTYPSLVGVRGSGRQLKTNYDITRTVLQPESQLYNMMNIENKIAISILYRGATTHFETINSLDKLKAEQSPYCVFEEWSPFRFKVGINDFPLKLDSYRNINGRGLSSLSCCSLTSSLEFRFPLARDNYKFDLMFAKRAFVHFFDAYDMEEGQFSEARQHLAALEKDYAPLTGIYVQDELEDFQEDY